jgi:RecB family exonuclease
MRILAGLQLGGATLTALDDLGVGHGVIGDAVWGPAELLRDLELRLGLSTEEESDALRVARWAGRMDQLAPAGRFYTRSFGMDPLGTARAVLTLRDLLVGAGWRGQEIAGGGPRLDGIRELENLHAATPLPIGVADRVAAVARAAASTRVRYYSELRLAESRELWPSTWQLVFMALEHVGTRVSRDAVSLTGASADSDLGRIQAALKSDAAVTPTELRGDGSFVRLVAETSWEAARATAAVLAGLPPEHSVVIRELDESALDNALSVQNLCTQGWRSQSPWRAALQVLPLALELAFEPKDPYRILELLTLPVGPFQGMVGHALARALADSPGIGSPEWERTKTDLAKRPEQSVALGRVGEWLEQRGSEAIAGAPKADVLAVVARVRAWVLTRIKSAPDDETLLAAARQAGALLDALDGDPRTTFNLVEARRVAESILASGTTVKLEEERAGRVDHVKSAGGLILPRDVVVWWSFVEDESGHRPLPWRQKELVALEAARLRFPDPRARLRERAHGWRRAILAATRRVILVSPRSSAGKTLRPHPLWDEVIARTRADAAAISRLSVSASDLLARPSTQSLLGSPELDAVDILALPGGHPEWVLPGGHAEPFGHVSATSLNALLGCPLQWVLRYRAGIRTGGHALPPLFLLNGTLGHRLVEKLHAQGAFDLDGAELERRANAELDELIVREGAVLLRSGMGFERSQLRSQLVRSMLELSRLLRAAGLRIIAVEKPIDVAWRDTKLVGQIDLLVSTADGVQAIIDVKWGSSSYRKLLSSGRALQLAAYAFAYSTERGDRQAPDAAYFSLKKSRMLGLPSRLWLDGERIDGPSLEETWRRVERSVAVAEGVIQKGMFPVAGVRRALPLLSAFEIPENDQKSHFALEPDEVCKYCNFQSLCGRRWEGTT